MLEVFEGAIVEGKLDGQKQRLVILRNVWRAVHSGRDYITVTSANTKSQIANTSI
jgi:hypothetical protein